MVNLISGAARAAALFAAALAIDAAAGRAASAASDTPAASAPALSSAAQTVYAAALPRILQIRTLVGNAGQQASIGSGFLVSADGLAITNYHVVSQMALEPSTYRLEYLAADGTRGSLSVEGVDLANDLAVLRIDKPGASFFTFGDAEAPRTLAKGERLYSLGNPLDLGFTINEGTYNGPVERSYSERIHFTGALNPGMSGGPSVTADGVVVGINVAKRTGGELVSFLVPARFAVALLERVASRQTAPDLKAEIARQLAARQSELHRSFIEQGFRSVALGPYRAPEPTATWFDCWAQTNAGATPKPRASINSTSCNSDSRVFVANDLTIGAIQLNHSYVRAIDLNQFQLASLLTQMSQPRVVGGGPFRKWYTPERCHEDFVSTSVTPEHPPMRVAWCAQAYREFAGLYDVALIVVTQDQGSEALVSRMNLQAVTFDTALALTRRVLEAIQISK